MESAHTITAAVSPWNQASNATSRGRFVVLSNDFFGTGLWYKSQYLREAQVNILADDVCRHEDYYANLITDNMLCAARPDWSQDACQVFPTSPGWMLFFCCLVDSLLVRLFLAGRLWRAAGL